MSALKFSEVILDNGEIVICKHDANPESALRRMPGALLNWFRTGLLNNFERIIWDLIEETYSACRHNLKLLAVVGMRSVLEHTMIYKNGTDQESFGKYLNLFCQNNFISEEEKQQLHAILEVGHATTHRIYSPSIDDFNIVFPIAEKILIRLFNDHSVRTKELMDRIPPRQRQNKK